MKFPKLALPTGSTLHHAQCGQAMLNLHFTMRQPGRAEISSGTDSTCLVAWACGLESTTQMHQYIGHLVKTKGFDFTSKWVSELYSPFTQNIISEPIGNSASSQSGHLLDETLRTPLPQNNSNISRIAPSHSIDRSMDLPKTELSVVSNDEALQRALMDSMDLFDSETWLQESPSAQKLWKEANE